MNFSFEEKMFCSRGGSEFLSFEMELQNLVTQNDVALQVNNSKSNNKKLHIELLTQ